MFPHTVTVFNVIKSKDNISYHRQEVKDVFYHIEKIISHEGKGEKYTFAYQVIFSDKAIKNYVNKSSFKADKDTYTLKENDIIVIGSCEKINDLKELQKSNTEFFLIKTVSENLYGSEDMHNIEVTNW